MLSLRKSSIFFSKISKIYVYLLKNDIFAIYNFYGSFFYNFKKILSNVDLKKFNYILMSSSFVNLVFNRDKLNFFNFLSPFSFVCFFLKFNDFLEFQVNLSNFFLIAVCYKFFFFSRFYKCIFF